MRRGPGCVGRADILRGVGPPGWVAVLFRVLFGSGGGAMAHGEVRLTTTASGHPAWLVGDHGTVRRLLTDPRLDVYHEDPAGAPRCFASGPFGPPISFGRGAGASDARRASASAIARRAAGVISLRGGNASASAPACGVSSSAMIRLTHTLKRPC